MRKPTTILLLLALCLFLFISCGPDEGGTISVLTATLLDEMEESLLSRIGENENNNRNLKLGDTIAGFTTEDVIRILNEAESAAREWTLEEDQIPEGQYLCIYQSAAETIVTLASEKEEFSEESALEALFYTIYSSLIPRIPAVAELLTEERGGAAQPRTDFGMVINPGWGHEEAFVLEGAVDYSRKSSDGALGTIRLGAGQMANVLHDTFKTIEIPPSRLAAIQEEMIFKRLDTSSIPIYEPLEPPELLPGGDPGFYVTDISDLDIAQARINGLLDAMEDEEVIVHGTAGMLFSWAAEQALSEMIPTSSLLETQMDSLLAIAMEMLNEYQQDGSWDNYYNAAQILTEGVCAIADMAHESDWEEIFSLLPESLATAIDLIADSGSNKYYEFVSGLVDSLELYIDMHPSDDPVYPSPAAGILSSCAEVMTAKLVEYDGTSGPWPRAATFLVALDNYIDESIRIEIDSSGGPTSLSDFGEGLFLSMIDIHFN